MGGRPRRVTRLVLMLGLSGLAGVRPPVARSQDSPAPVVPQAESTGAVLEEIMARLRAMEATNRELAEQIERNAIEHQAEMQALRQRYEEVNRRLQEETPTRAELEAMGVSALAPEAEPPAVPGPTGRFYDDQADDPGSPVPDYRDGAATPDWPLPEERPANLLRPTRVPLRSTFGPGFRFESLDEEYMLQVEYESQIESRIWSEDGQIPANSGFYFPRQRFFFRGHITRPLEYEISVNRGLNNINILNAYVNLHLDDRLEFRLGRFFTPLGYEQYAISNYWLLTPERSPFITNVGLNRQIGLMAWGYLLDKRLDYAAGVFNGSRNSFESLNNAADFVGFLNTRPFQKSESLPFLRFLNLGGSVGFGHQDQPPAPVAFRIGGGSPDTNIPGLATVPFLILNRDVIERGDRLVGSAQAAYFYKSLALIGEWQFGYNSYSTAERRSSVQVPLAGFYVAGGYFLTGEHAERRTAFGRFGLSCPSGRVRDSDRGPGNWPRGTPSFGWGTRCSARVWPTRISGRTQPPPPRSV